MENSTELTFRETMLRDLGIVLTKVSAIEEHLRTLNGKVVKHEEQIAANHLAFVQHVSNCPFAGKDLGNIMGSKADKDETKEIGERIEKLEVIAAENKARGVSNQNVIKIIMPIVYSLGGAIIVLLLTHADVLLKYWK